MKILETDRLILREVTADDAEFILDLVNQPSFIQYIGDRGVRTLDQARNYIESRFTKNYHELGFGMYAVELKNDAEARTSVMANSFTAADPHATSKSSTLPTGRVFALDEPAAIGICGFVKRDELPHADIGFAFLPRYGGMGYASESAQAMLDYGRDKVGFARVLAITTIDNEASVRLLGKLGFAFDRQIKIGNEILKLFSCDL